MNLSLSRRARTLLASLAIVGGAVALTTPVAEAAGSNGAVYVLGNQTSGNNVLVFARHADGTLAAPVSVSTGGTGTGGGLGSQGAIVLDESGRHLYAVNAGSNTITSFRVRPNGLERVDVVDSGGVMPTSIAVDGDLVYVLNAGGDGSITGFSADDGDLAPLAGSTRPLSGAATAPAQVSFTPDGDAVARHRARHPEDRRLRGRRRRPGDGTDRRRLGWRDAVRVRLRQQEPPDRVRGVRRWRRRQRGVVVWRR